MPLPKPPTKRADMLTDADFASQPRTTPRTTAPSTARSSGSGPTRRSAVASAPAAPVPAVVNEAPRSARKSAGKPAPQVTAVSVPAPAGSAKTAKTGLDRTPPSTPQSGGYPAPTVRRKRDVGGPAKLFVLDTNVLLHDPMSLFRFDEHDIYLPMITLEELDGHKKGMTEVARNAR